ncbi:putative transcription factor WD40-like family [Helianthus annuus]|nr:putative transcription factor WD40-like family [Helianthus annuus]
MDNIQLSTSVDADCSLPASPRIRFNKDGALLAVSAQDNGIKILANSDGLRLLRTFENLSFDGSATLAERISRLIYANSGNALLALAANAIHFLWKWQRNECNSSGKATVGVSPQLRQPSSGILMTNDVTMTTFMSSPPAATFFVFYPQDNNIIAIGMDDSTIQI